MTTAPANNLDASALALVDTEGEVFSADLDGELPQFVGPEGSSGEVARRFREFGAALEPRGLTIAELKLSPRTLQRKLSEAGATFQQVLDQARFGLAKEYLRQPDLSLVDIAFLLGYQEQSAFNHAFKEWAGVNPGAYRG